MLFKFCEVVVCTRVVFCGFLAFGVRLIRVGERGEGEVVYCFVFSDLGGLVRVWRDTVIFICRVLGGVWRGIVYKYREFSF